MSKLIRFDEDHFGFLIESDISVEQAKRFTMLFQEWWPEKRLIVMVTDEFVDLTGQYEIVPIPDAA